MAKKIDKTHLEKNYRVIQVVKAILLGYTKRAFLIQFLSDKYDWDCTERTIDNYIKAAKKIIRNQYSDEELEIEKDIAKLVSQSIDIINAPKDADGDGEDDFEFLDKWKHIQILLAISSEAANVFDLFKNVIEEDATIMDDKGRLTLIRDAYKDATQIKATIRAQLRRINKEIYQYQRLKKEIKIYEEFFSKNS